MSKRDERAAWGEQPTRNEGRTSPTTWEQDRGEGIQRAVALHTARKVAEVEALYEVALMVDHRRRASDRPPSSVERKAAAVLARIGDL